MTAAPAPDVTDRTNATDEEFAARIAGYPADVAHAAMVEQVARAMAPAWVSIGLSEATPLDDLRTLAAAAIAALPAHPAEEALRRVEALADDLHTDARSMWTSAETHESETDEMVGDTYYEVSKRIRAALAPQPADAEGTRR